MEYRYERDSMGEIMVPRQSLWGAQTQRSVQNFHVGEEKMPLEVIRAIAYVKKACAFVNRTLKPNKMTIEKVTEISKACDEIIEGKLDEHFPLSVWQTGSGTQTNMNVNEVIANRGNASYGKKLLHPNDDVNMSQSSNDVFPTAMHISAVLAIENNLVKACANAIKVLENLEKKFEGIIKVGRTHLQDATPIAFSQEISAWRWSIENALAMIRTSLVPLKGLAIGGTAVGTGINAPKEFAVSVVNIINNFTNNSFYSAYNKFHALSFKDDITNAHSALKTLAVNLMKIANDIRLLSSGPRCGLGEINIPANEPGSSIMPGKVNPTQCEMVTMVAVQVMANDVAIGISASQGNFELNVFMPLIINDFLQSVRLLTDAINSFTKNCLIGIEPIRAKMRENFDKNLMTVTALCPYIGYDRAVEVAKFAHEHGVSLRTACEKLNYLTLAQYDTIVKADKLI